MNKKAENFKAYLDRNKINCFIAEEIPNDHLHTTVFRSSIDINGQQLPTLLLLDDSIYAMIRVLVSPKSLTKENSAGLFGHLNDLNKQYKSFKYYFDDTGNLVLDCCLLCPEETIAGNFVYTMFNVIIKHVNSEYKNLMKLIWK